MTDSAKIERVNVSSIQVLPVVTKNISEKLVNIIANLAKSSPDDIPPILVGRVNSLLYPINEFETVSGLLKAEVKTVEVLIVDYPTMQDLIVNHVRKNFQPHTIDPLRIREVIKYMTKNNNMDVSEACKVLWIDRRPDLLNAVHCEITDKAKSILDEMIAEVSKKAYFITTPILYVERLSKIDEAVQAQAALELKSITISTMKYEDKSFWPSAESIKLLLATYPKKIEKLPKEERIAKMTHLADMKKKKEDETAKKKEETTAKKKARAKTAKKADDYISPDPDLIYVSPGEGIPDFVVNRKTCRAAKVGNVDGVCSLQDDFGDYTHMLPKRVAKFFDVDNFDNANIYEFATFEKAESSLARSKMRDKKCVIITFATLPRR